jgi:hypothetical protein
MAHSARIATWPHVRSQDLLVAGVNSRRLDGLASAVPVSGSAIFGGSDNTPRFSKSCSRNDVSGPSPGLAHRDGARTSERASGAAGLRRGSQVFSRKERSFFARIRPSPWTTSVAKILPRGARTVRMPPPRALRLLKGDTEEPRGHVPRRRRASPSETGSTPARKQSCLPR